MTATVALNGTTAAAASTAVNNGLAGLTSNFQTFLTLLTTQLKNQDPLKPVDSNAFTQQLVQMSGVQQQLLTNNLLTTLVGQGGNLSGGVNYIGKTITAASATAPLTAGKATWSYELAKDAASAEFEIDNASGAAVWKGAAPDSTSGIHAFNWNGKDLNGKQLPDGGGYTLKITARDSVGAAIDAQALIRGTATAVQMINSTPYLTIGASIVPLSSVIGVESAPAA